MFAIDLPCDRSLDLMWQTVERLTHFIVLGEQIFLFRCYDKLQIDTFFAFRSFLVEEQNFQLPLSVRSLLTWRARVKCNPLVTVKIKVADLSWNRNNHVTLLSDANIPVRSRTQQRAKYSSQQFMANCITAIRCLRWTDLRITKHRGHKFPPSLRLFSF